MNMHTGACGSQKRVQDPVIGSHKNCESPDVSVGYSRMGVSGVCYCVGAGNIIKCS